MLNLAHHALFEFSKSNPCDTEHPVIMDQIFDVEMNRLTNQRIINCLKAKIKKLKHKVHAMSSLKLIDINFVKTDKISLVISHELFTIFNWNKVMNEEQASWKEYFHMLYELLVSDYDNDHTGNVILARSIIKYHNVLTVPEKMNCNDPMYSIISSIDDSFRELKVEQVVIYDSLKHLKTVIKDIQQRTTLIQCEIVKLQMEMRACEADNEKYFQMIKWSVR